MKKIFLALVALFFTHFAYAQEFIATVNVDYSQVENSNVQVFQTLQRSLKDFINTTKWTSKNLKTHEKIEANFNIIIDSRSATNTYKGKIQIQSRRPVFNSTYHTPILNFQDTDFSFEYVENEILTFNERQFSGKNLTDVVVYYVYFILGMDADTFKREGGTEYFTICQKIANNAGGQKYGGWSAIDGPKSRITLVNNILGADNKTLRNLMYQYHRMGLDVMNSNETRAKNVIGDALLTLSYYQKGNFAQFFPLDLFFQAKKDEISQIFGGGIPSNVNIAKLKELLIALNPNSIDLWNKLKK